MTYAMLKQRGVVGNQYEFIIYDEARHLMQIDEVCNEELDTIQRSSELDLNEWINGIKTKYFPSIYGAGNEDVNWSAIESAITEFGEFLYAKIGGEYVMDGWLKHDPEYLQKACQRECPRIYREEQEKKRVEDSLMDSEDDTEGNASVITLNKEKIEGMLFSLLRWYSSADGLPDDVDREMKKAIRCLNVLYKIAGSQRIELEVLEHPPSNEYSLHLRAFREKAIPRGNLTIYIDATPYPPQLYEHWLQLQPEELNIAHLQSNIPVTIVVEDAKKTYPDTYGRGDKSEGYKSHLRLLRGLKKRFEDKGLTVAVAARNKMASQMLGSNEVEVDVVCGDVKAEGVQLDADVTVMEGVQIKNIGVDESQKFELARGWEAKGRRDRLWKLIHPNKIWRLIHKVENCQTMMQTAFRAIDREGKRANIIVILGHKMAHKAPGKMEVTGWTDLAKKWFTFLKEDCVRVVHINKGLKIENKVEEIVQVANTHYDFSLTAFQNVLLDYLRTRPRGAKRKTIEDNIIGSTEKIGDALRELVEKGKVERTKKGVYKYIPK